MSKVRKIDGELVAGSVKITNDWFFSVCDKLSIWGDDFFPTIRKAITTNNDETRAICAVLRSGMLRQEFRPKSWSFIYPSFDEVKAEISKYIGKELPWEVRFYPWAKDEDARTEKTIDLSSSNYDELNEVLTSNSEQD